MTVVVSLHCHCFLICVYATVACPQTGEIPSSLCNLRKLVGLHLCKNRLGGKTGWILVACGFLSPSALLRLRHVRNLSHTHSYAHTHTHLLTLALSHFHQCSCAQNNHVIVIVCTYLWHSCDLVTVFLIAHNPLFLFTPFSCPILLYLVVPCCSLLCLVVHYCTVYTVSTGKGSIPAEICQLGDLVWLDISLRHRDRERERESFKRERERERERESERGREMGMYIYREAIR